MRSASVSLMILTVLAAGVFASAEAPDPDRQPPRSYEDGPSGMDHPPGPHWRRGESGRVMSEREVRQALEVLRKIDPQKAEQLGRHADQDPQRVARALHEEFPKLRRLLQIKRHDPEGFALWVDDLRLNRNARQSAGRLRHAEARGDDVLAAAEEVALRQILAEHFQVRQDIREHQLRKLENQIAELREQLDDRASDRDELIDRRYEELTGEPSGGQW